MASPFPGMDPFLEGAEIFSDLHPRLINAIRERIQAKLAHPYYARLRGRDWIEPSIWPAALDASGLGAPRAHSTREAHGGGAAVAEDRTSRVVVVRIPHEERHESFIEIFAGRDEQRRLVTAIEVLSPTNKTPGEHGRDLYVRKQQEVLDSRVHLVEIDLLRGGSHTTAVPRELAVAAAGEFDYHVCVHRFDAFEDYVVYPILLKERLPVFEVPLLPEDDSITVDLQEVFDHCYVAGAYDREVDYGGVVSPPLSLEQEA